MNGWLTLWLGLAAFGPAGIILAVLYDRVANEDRHYEVLGVIAIICMMLVVSAVGVLGTIGWLVAWAIG